MIGDLVFDPFAGSGTLGKAAINLDRKFLLTEIDKRYFEAMRRDFHKGDFLTTDALLKRNITFLTIDQFTRRLKKWQ